MRSILALQSLLLCLVALAQAAKLTVHIPASEPLLPNPSTLPPSTHATLLGPDGQIRRALLTRSNNMAFSSLPLGSHLLNIHSKDHKFPPLRVDVTASTTADGTKEIVEVYQTFRGHEWSNKGQKYGSGEGELLIQIPPVERKTFYTQRSGFNFLSILKNPMILMGMVSLALVFGMPKLMENMDEESKAEFEEMSKSSPLSGSQGAAASLQNFDLASFLAGGSKSSNSGQGSAKK